LSGLVVLLLLLIYESLHLVFVLSLQTFQLCRRFFLLLFQLCRSFFLLVFHLLQVLLGDLGFFFISSFDLLRMLLKNILLLCCMLRLNECESLSELLLHCELVVGEFLLHGFDLLDLFGDGLLMLSVHLLDVVKMIVFSFLLVSFLLFKKFHQSFDFLLQLIVLGVVSILSFLDALAALIDFVLQILSLGLTCSMVLLELITVKSNIIRNS